MAENDKQTEEKIFQAATEVFLLKGMDGARMQDIADRAGINKSLLHYYFRSKERLFDAVFAQTARQVFARFSPVLDPRLTVEEKIRFFMREHIGFLEQNPHMVTFMLNEVNRDPARINKFIDLLDIENLWSQLSTGENGTEGIYRINRETLPQLLITIISMSVFPFAARGILEGIFQKTGMDFNAFIEARKTFAAEFVIKALSTGL